MYQISPSKQPNSLIVKIVDGDFFSNINLGRKGLYVRLSISCAAPSLHKQCGRNEAQRLISFLPFWKSLGKKTLRDFWNHTFAGKSHRIINYPNTFTVALHTVHSLARQSMAAFWGAWDTSLSSLAPPPPPVRLSAACSRVELYVPGHMHRGAWRRVPVRSTVAGHKQVAHPRFATTSTRCKTWDFPIAPQHCPQPQPRRSRFAGRQLVPALLQEALGVKGNEAGQRRGREDPRIPGRAALCLSPCCQHPLRASSPHSAAEAAHSGTAGGA